MTIIYKIIRINGDYALAQSGSGLTTNIALALLPLNIEEGDTIMFENYEYTQI